MDAALSLGGAVLIAQALRSQGRLAERGFRVKSTLLGLAKEE